MALEDLDSPTLPRQAVPLSQARILREEYYRHAGTPGDYRTPDGSLRRFLPGSLLVKFRGTDEPSTLRVQTGREVESLDRVRRRGDVLFAELDVLQERQLQANDPLIGSQWHHAVLGSADAWAITTGSSAIRIGIVDTPFQMDHPDLQANVDPGWSVVTNDVVAASEGIEHSTLGAGLAAAVFNNSIGVAGMANCRLVPIHINGFTSEMYDAIRWAADHDVRVVNISWTGADSDVLNEAGAYLQTVARGIVAMPGVNGIGFLNYPNQPYIYCISMTDEADNMRSRNGDHIDFAAPGDAIFSTTVGSGYTGGSGTSFATPVFSGVVAALFSINPDLSSDEAIEIIKATAEDKGSVGWDRFFGWGRIDFGRAAQAARNTLPSILKLERSATTVSVLGSYRPGLEYTLWTTPSLPPAWTRVTAPVMETNGNVIRFEDRGDPSARFYQIRAAR